jgi:hypothetical protein
MDSSYATGGEALPVSAFGLSTIDFAIAKVGVAGTGAVTAAAYNPSTALLKCYTASAEVANTTDLSAVTIRILAFGK